MGIHIIPLFPQLRGRIIDFLGITPYKIIFSIIATFGILLLFLSRFEMGEYYKDPSEIFFNYRYQIIFFANFLICSAYIPNNHIRYFFKHPMLIGLIILSFAHFMFNEHFNHLMSFIGLSIFSLIMLIGVIIRDKSFIKKKVNTNKKVSVGYTILTLIVSLISFKILILLHHYIAGVKLL